MQKQVRLFFLLIAIYWFLKNSSLVQAQVTISEIYPNPNSDEEEWLELFNKSNQTVKLESWQIWDQLSKPTNLYQFSSEESIAPFSYLVLPFKNVFNNSGDTVLIYDDQQVIQDSITYTSSEKNYSWSKKATQTEIFKTEQTPGQPNIFPEPTQEPTPTPVPTITTNPTPTIKNTMKNLNSNELNQSEVKTTAEQTQKNLAKKNQYQATLKNLTINLPNQNKQLIQSIFIEPPQLEIGAINVIMGSLLLLVPGLIYAKKQKIF